MAQPSAFVVRPSATSAYRRGFPPTASTSTPMAPESTRPGMMSSVACGTDPPPPPVVAVPSSSATASVLPTIITPRGLSSDSVRKNLRHVVPPTNPSKYVVVALPSAVRPPRPQVPSSSPSSVVSPSCTVTQTPGLPLPQSTTRNPPPSTRTTVYLPVTYIPPPSVRQARPRFPQSVITSTALVKPTVTTSTHAMTPMSGAPSSSFIGSKAPILPTGSVIRLPQAVTGATNVIAPGMNLIPVLSNGNVYFVHPTVQPRPSISLPSPTTVNGFNATVKPTMVSTSTSTPASHSLHKFRFQRPTFSGSMRTASSVELAAKLATQSIESQRRNVSMAMGKGALVDKACQSSLKRRSTSKRKASSSSSRRRKAATVVTTPSFVVSPVKPVLSPVVPVDKPTRPLIQHQMISQFSVTLCEDDDVRGKTGAVNSTGSSIQVSPVIDDFVVKPCRFIPGLQSPLTSSSPSSSTMFGSSFSIMPSPDPRGMTIVNNACSASQCAPCYPTPPPSVSSTVDVCRSTPPSPSPLPPSPVRPSVNTVGSPSHCQASSPLHQVVASPPRPPKPPPPPPSLQVVKNLSAEFTRPVASLAPPPPPPLSPPVPPPPAANVFLSPSPVPPPKTFETLKEDEKPVVAENSNSQPVFDAFDALMMSLNSKPTRSEGKHQVRASSSVKAEDVTAKLEQTVETEVSEVETKKDESVEAGRKRKKKKKKRKKIVKKLTPSDLRRLEKRPVKWLNVAPKPPSRMQGMSDDGSPLVVKQLKDYKLAMRLERRDLFPLALVPSDASDEDTDSDGDLTRQKTWFRVSEFLPLQDRLKNKRSAEGSEEEEDSPVEKRRKLLMQVKRNLRARNKQLKESARAQSMKSSERRSKMAVTVAKAARKHAVVLGRTLAKNKSTPALKALSKRRALIPKSCSYVISDAICGDQTSCGEAALPLAAYCRLHVVSAPEQHLFRKCEAFGSVTYCDNPAVLLKNDAPICEEHMFPRLPPLTAAELAQMAAKKAKKRTRNAQFLRKRRRKPGTGKSKCVSPPLKPPSSPPTPPHRRSPPPSPFDFGKNGDGLEPPFIADPSFDLPEFGDSDNLLDGTDIDALYRMPDDAFTDLFADANGVAQLEPTIEDTKALEEALRAGDFDVQSLAEGLMERLTSELPLGTAEDPSSSASLASHVVPHVHLEQALMPIQVGQLPPMVQATTPPPPPSLPYGNISFDTLPPPPPYSTAVAMTSSTYDDPGSRDVYQFCPNSFQSVHLSSPFMPEPLPMIMDEPNAKEIVLESHVIPTPVDFQRQNGTAASSVPVSGS